jgi:integrase
MARTTNVKIRDQHSILDGEATIYRVPLSGDVYQFRMYLRDERKHFRKSLRTRDLDSALTKAKQLALQILGKKEAGKKVFGISLQALVEQYIAFRERHVKSEDITPGRLVTIKSQLKHFIRAKGKDLKVSELDKSSIYHWRLIRKESHPGVKDVTVRNETATLNALCKWAYREGLIHFPEFEFEPIRIRKSEIGRRDTFTLGEWEALIKFNRTYVAKKNCLDRVERSERLLMRDFVLIAANTGMRVGELRQLTWADIGKIWVEKDEYGGDITLVETNVRKETSKVQTSRSIITRGGEYFKRIKSRLEVVDPSARVFAGSDKNGGIPARIWERHWRNMMEGIGLDYKGRNVTWYSLRHFCISMRVRSGVDIIDIAKQAGTSVGHIENTYLKYTDDMKINAARKSVSVPKHKIK